MILRSSVILPISAPAIRNGAVAVRGNRVVAVGRWRELRAAWPGPVVDLGHAVILPGLVNAHCHLDYTHMAGQFSQPKLFTDWLKVITATKSGWNLSDYRESWTCGAEMLVQSGTTTVADIEAVAQLLPDIWAKTPLRVVSLLEMIGITQRRTPAELLGEAVEKIRTLRHRRCRAGLSPHAPYSTSPELLRLTARAARRYRLPVCTHVSESALELEMFRNGRGIMFDWLQRSGRDMSDCGHSSPVGHLARCGLLGKNLISAHANYLARNDTDLLARAGVSVVHCPRTYAYFRHDTFPLKTLLRAQINLCLGTDSLASVVKVKNQELKLSLREEMRTLGGREPSLSPRTIVRMATINGAQALGMKGKIGELIPGGFADIIAIALATPRQDPYEAVLQASGPVLASMIDGAWAVCPSRPGLDSSDPRRDITSTLAG